MKKLLLLVLASLPLSVLAQGGLPDKPYIYVEGKGEIEKPADMVTLRFDLVARDAEQAKANADVQAKAASIFALIKDRKIAQNDVVAGDLRSEAQFEDDEESSRKRRKLIGYSVTRIFAVTIRDVTIFPKLVDELLAIAGVEFSSVEAGLSNEKQVQDEIGKRALINAREQAEKTLKEIGMKIDSIFAASPVAFTQIQRGIFGSGFPTAETESALPAQSRNASEYRLAPINVSQRIHVIYLISPAK
jgi:uncharacterized protein YggE